MELELYKLEASEKMEHGIERLEINLSRISTGRANPQILNSVKVNYFKTLTPINQLASISVPEPRQLLIKPFDMSVNKFIAQAINSASLGVNAVDEGDKTRISIPDLTKERRIQLIKQAKESLEQSKILIRQGRKYANKLIKDDSDLSEDDLEYYESEIQALTNKYSEKLETMFNIKKTELETI
jgi:ribosome recycling factor